MEKTHTAKLELDGKVIELPVVYGPENEVAVDISTLRKQTGIITLDPGFGNTGACQSAITFVDGEKGILRYRGYPIEQMAERSSFIETAMLLIFGELPTSEERNEFRTLLRDNEMLHEDMLHHFEGFPPNGHPMAIMSAVLNSLGSYHGDLLDIQNKMDVRRAAAKIISKVRTIAAFAYKKSIGEPVMYPDPNLSYCRNFLHMMFSIPYRMYEPPQEVVRALTLFLIVHADHEQNCSCSTVRMVGSTQANLFASVSAGVCALWGKLHGGANSAVMEMLDYLLAEKISVTDYLEQVKQRKFRLMGFGHRVYKNFDPRARVLKRAAHDLLDTLGLRDDLLDVAQELEEAALHDEYFIERSLYPNVDFYSGLILRALGVPVPMYPVMFAIGRMPGWIAHWYEESKDQDLKIHRPRQIYIGPGERNYVPMHKR